MLKDKLFLKKSIIQKDPKQKKIAIKIIRIKIEIKNQNRG
jgi:hypothetical protein